MEWTNFALHVDHDVICGLPTLLGLADLSHATDLRVCDSDHLTCGALKRVCSDLHRYVDSSVGKQFSSSSADIFPLSVEMLNGQGPYQMTTQTKLPIKSVLSWLHKYIARH